MPVLTLRHTACLVLACTVLALPAKAQTGMLSADGGKGVPGNGVLSTGTDQVLPPPMPATNMPVQNTPAANTPAANIPAMNMTPSSGTVMNPSPVTAPTLAVPAVTPVQTTVTKTTQTTTAATKTTTTTTTTGATPPVASKAMDSRAFPLSPNNPDFALPQGLPEVEQRQKLDEQDALKSPVFRILDADMQDRIIAEANSFNQDCKSNILFSAMHDCDCQALHYMNERLRNPDYSTSKIRDIITYDCVDKPGMAGYAYKQCLAMYQTSYGDILKPLCECYAREWTNIFSTHPGTTMEYQVSVNVRSFTDCRDKITAPKDSIPVQNQIPPE